MKPMRVLQVIGIMNRGGAEAMIMNLYRNIDRTKVQFDFVEHTDQKAVFDDEITALGGKIYHCPKYVGTNHFQYTKWWNTFFQEHSGEYPVIHGHIGSTAAIYLKIAKKYGLYTIAHSHSTKATIDIKSILYRMWSYPTRYIADCFFACSHAAAEARFGKKVASGNRCICFNNAIDIDKFSFSAETRQEVRKEFGIPEDVLLVGTVGRLTLPKNPMGIIEIFKAMRKKQTNVKLLWVGDGELRSEIEDRLQQENLTPDVIMTGSRPDVDRLLQAMDVFIFPSLWEGLPVSLIEAQTAGLSCLCSDTVSQEAAVTELCAFLPLPQPELWADRILSVDKTRKDVTQQIRDAGYDIAKTSHWLGDFYCKRL